MKPLMLKASLLFLLLFFGVVVFGQKNNPKNNPKVLAVYPNSDSIPVNILRFYVQFSVPMQEMDILKHIKLADENGKNLTGVFFENQYELWNENRTLVTLIIDPGRVKLGLLANNKMGRAFDEGKKYTLTIDSLLLDFNNRTLSKSFTKIVTAVQEDRLAPDIKNWKLHLPKCHSKQAITIHFNDKIDYISAQTLITIFKDEVVIKGAFLLINQDQTLTFIPYKNWKKGNYTIRINSQLEDIAANSLNQVFDHKPSDFEPKITKYHSLYFTIR